MYIMLNDALCQNGKALTGLTMHGACGRLAKSNSL